MDIHFRISKYGQLYWLAWIKLQIIENNLAIKEVCSHQGSWGGWLRVACSHSATPEGGSSHALEQLQLSSCSMHTQFFPAEEKGLIPPLIYFQKKTNTFLRSPSPLIGQNKVCAPSSALGLS